MLRTSTLVRPALALWTTALGAGGCGDAEPLPTGEVAATITHYHYAFDLTTRRATATLTASVTTAGDCLALPFRAADIDQAATWNGEPASGSLTDGVLTLCGPGVAAGSTLVLEVTQTVALETWAGSQVGYSETTDADGNLFRYLVSWVGGCDRFAPCDHRPEMFATYTFDVTHPPEVTVRCPGDISQPSDTLTRCDFNLPGGPTYSTFGIVASTGWTMAPATWGALSVEIYDRPSTGVSPAIDDTFAAGFIAFMENLVGPYPYGDRLRILTGPTYWSGFEHPGNIVLSDELDGASRFAEPVAHTLAHELAHMWAGNQTTLAGQRDFVWKEAMAEYLTYAYERTVAGFDAAATPRAWRAFSSGARYYPVPDEVAPLLDTYGDAYGPGPMMLFRQLEVLSSSEQVLAAISEVLGQARALTIEEVEAALASHTGLDLTGYFDAWIHGSGAPAWLNVAFAYTQDGNGDVSLRVAQSNPQVGPRPCVFELELGGATAGEQQRVTVDFFTGANDQTLTVPDPGFTVTRVTVDPDATCLVYPRGALPAATP